LKAPGTGRSNLKSDEPLSSFALNFNLRCFILVKPRYFRLMDSEAPVTVDEAGNFYETDEYELACLERGRTPFTRKAVTKVGRCRFRA